MYFTLILVFFISVAGLTLRKQFAKPYVKPLIITVGLMLTVGVFMMKEQLAMILGGFGVLGSLLLVILVATIPYGLCVGFGMEKSKAFYVTYILIYLLSWVKYSSFHDALLENHLGFVSVALLILFIVAVLKMIKFNRAQKITAGNFKSESPYKPEIEKEISIEDQEFGAEKKQINITKFEADTIEDMTESLADIQYCLETNNGTLIGEDRQKVATLLKEMTKKEEHFKERLKSLQKVLQRVVRMDVADLAELERRHSKARGKQRHILQEEIKSEKRKIETEKVVAGYEAKLGQAIEAFNQCMGAAFDHVSRSSYPLGAKPYLARARQILKDISDMLKEMKEQEKKIVKLIKEEESLLKHERKAA